MLIDKEQGTNQTHHSSYQVTFDLDLEINFSLPFVIIQPLLSEYYLIENDLLCYISAFSVCFFKNNLEGAYLAWY